MGLSQSHFYLDDGNFTVTMVADDEHQLPGIATHQVRVNNVAPTLVVGGGTFDEGVLADLSLPPFNRELLKNRGFEEGTFVGELSRMLPISAKTAQAW